MSKIEVLDPSKTTLIDMASGSNPVYLGEADSVQPTFLFTVASVSKAAAAVLTITAHGLQSDNAIVISDGTGDWAALNGRRIVTVLTANTFSVAVDSSLFAASFGGSVTTTAPRTSASCWRLRKNYYDGSNNATRTSFAAGGASNQTYDNRASLEYN